jgi:anti-anti-sigma regulatory factor
LTAHPDRARTTVALPAVLDQRTLDEARDGLIAGLAAGDVLVDGAAVERVATVGLHLLLAAERSASDAGRKLSLRPSLALEGALADLGLGARFAPWIEA